MADNQYSDPKTFKKDVLGTPFESGRPPKRTNSGNGGNSKLPFVLSAAALAIGLVMIVFVIMLNTRFSAHEAQLEEQIASLSEMIETIQLDLEDGIEATNEKVETVSDDIAQVQKSVGLTRSQIERNRNLAQEIRQKQERDVQSLSEQLNVKADNTVVTTLEQESDTKFQEIDDQLEVVKEDVQESRAELEKTYQELLNLGLQVTEQGRLIATNGSGLDELRKKGERDYVEFDLQKKRRTSIAGIGVELRKADRKNARADFHLFYDDKKFERKKIYVNTPVNFFVGPEKVPYEFVINEVLKDRITGYISVPLGNLPTLELQRASNGG